MNNSLNTASAPKTVSKADLFFRLSELSKENRHDEVDELNKYINVLILEEKKTGVFISKLDFDQVSNFFAAS